MCWHVQCLLEADLELIPLLVWRKERTERRRANYCAVDTRTASRPERGSQLVMKVRAMLTLSHTPLSSINADIYNQLSNVQARCD